jgi:hypothetical protein
MPFDVGGLHRLSPWQSLKQLISIVTSFTSKTRLTPTCSVQVLSKSHSHQVEFDREKQPMMKTSYMLMLPLNNNVFQ